MHEFENVTGHDSFDPDSRYGGPSEAPAPTEQHELDAPAAQARLDKLNDWWYECRVKLAPNRYEMSIDDDYVDGLQYTEEDKRELAERNQAPLVFNEIKPAVEWVLGTEKRTRVDWKVLPRTDDDRDGAEIKTKVLKYVSDVNKSVFRRSSAFRDTVGVGLGWLEIGIRDDLEDEPLYMRRESWRNMWYDPLSVEPDLSDARYVFRSKVIDTDLAVAMFPDRKMHIETAAITRDRLPYWAEDDFFDSQLYYDADGPRTVHVEDALGASYGRREGVRFIEAWYRVPANVQVMRGAVELNGLEFDPQNPRMAFAIERGHASLFDALRLKVRVAVFIDGGVLVQDMPSSYRHNRFPFVPVWAYRRGRDNAPYGLVRNARDPQEDLNKRRSKALFMLSVNRTVMDRGAVEDMDDYEHQAADPSGIIEKRPGSHLEIHNNAHLAEEHVMLANQDSEYIRQTSGVTGENLGLETNATSGKAILARQNQGTVVTTTLFDNLRLAFQLSGEIMLSLVEQFYTDEKIVRVVGDRGEQEFIPINQQNPETGETINDITARQADFNVSEQDYRESLRMAMFDQLMDMLGKVSPEVALQLLDLVLEFSDLPGKDEMVRRVRKLTGQTDPDSPEAEGEEEAREQAQAEEQRERAELMIRELTSKIAERDARTEKLRADATHTNLRAMGEAQEAAVTAVQAPGVAQVADDLLQGAEAAKERV